MSSSSYASLVVYSGSCAVYLTAHNAPAKSNLRWVYSQWIGSTNFRGKKYQASQPKQILNPYLRIPAPPGNKTARRMLQHQLCKKLQHANKTNAARGRWSNSLPLPSGGGGGGLLLKSATLGNGSILMTFPSKSCYGAENDGGC